MKHKHSDLIHAWADGAQIQYKNIVGEWKDAPRQHMAWKFDEEYRIKPKEEFLKYRVALHKTPRWYI
jgi:hypothetical protein